MSRFTSIASAISQLEPGEHQEFCERFLRKYLKNGDYVGLGKEGGTTKTTIGNPDIYFCDGKGKYVFVVCSTTKREIYKKLCDDIKKCFDQEKTGIPVENIEEIIGCHTTSNLNPGDDCKSQYKFVGKGENKFVGFSPYSSAA